MNKLAFGAPLKHMNRIRPRLFTAEITEVLIFFAVRFYDRRLSLRRVAGRSDPDC